MAQGMFTSGGSSWSALVLTPPQPLVAGVVTELAVSDAVTNTSDNALTCTITYGAPTPDGADGGTAFHVWASIEAQDPDGGWYLLAAQNADYYHSGVNPGRRIVVDPGATVSNPGVDDQVWVGEASMLVSTHRAQLPATAFRLRIAVQDQAPDSAGAFASVPVTASWETHTV